MNKFLTAYNTPKQTKSKIPLQTQLYRLMHNETMIVEARHTVPEVGPWPGFSDMPDVFATAMMVGFMEQTCIQALRPYLEDGHGTVGISVNMSHVAPTPIGGKVTASVKLKSVEGRRYMFDVQISDTHGVIGVGSHERALINIAKFEQTVSRRKLGS